MLITAGIVVLADAGLTLVWQEPLSAAYGSLQQGQAEDQLEKLESEYPTAADLGAIAGVRGRPAKARILADRFEPRLREGHAIAATSTTPCWRASPPTAASPGPTRRW